jgi:hypothetical protein
MLGEVTWYKERYMRDISLGSLLVVVLVRTVHITLSKLRVRTPRRTHITHCSPRLIAHAPPHTHARAHNVHTPQDSYLPVHCLAAMGNMSMYLDNLHPYAAHRLIKLFEMYSRRHSSLLRRINKSMSFVCVRACACVRAI